MQAIHIQILDAVECEVLARDADFFYDALKYEYTTWHKKKYGTGTNTNIANAFSFDKGPRWRFWTGLLPRVRSAIIAKGGKVVIMGDHYWEDVKNHNPPFIPGETLRDYQLQFIIDSIKKTRGVIVSATGTGKTFIQLGIASCFPSEKFLLLADKVGIVKQTHKDAVDHYGAQRCQILDNPNNLKWLNICTRQKFINMDIESDAFTGILIDEVHHLSSFKCEYQAIMERMMAPLRFGFTGTHPKSNERERMLALESFIGPVIGEYTIQDGVEEGVLAVPKIKIIREDYSTSIRKLSRWPDVNNEGIINNMDHNSIVAHEASIRMAEGKSVLVFVNTVEHMLNLDILFKARPEKVRIKMVHSSVGKLPDEIKQLEAEQKTIEVAIYSFDKKTKARVKKIDSLIAVKREKIRRLTQNAKRSDEYKQWLIDGKINGAIATSTWREGVNIPPLNTIILAGGGKEARKILQEIGRGTRKVEGKDHIEIIDFFNPSHHHLINHFGGRLCEYLDNKWEFIND